MGITEGEELVLWEEEGDWSLVGRTEGEGVGFVPASYVEVGSWALSFLGDEMESAVF